MRAAMGLVFRASLRHGWTSLLAIALLVGVTGGAVLVGAAAARRTDTAFARMREATDAWDVLVNPDAGTESILTLESVGALPEVAEISRVDGLLLGPDRLESLPQLNDLPLTLATDGGIGYEFGRFQILEGDMPDQRRADEVLLTPAAADQLGLEVGDLYPSRLLTFEDFGAVVGDATAAEVPERYNELQPGLELDLLVTGIGVPIDELVVDDAFVSGTIVLTPAFLETHGRESVPYFGLQVRLAPGSSPEDLRRSVEGIAEGESVAFQSADRVEDQIGRAVDPEVGAIRVFTLIAGLVGLVIVGQAVSRRLQLDAASDPGLRALGLTRPQRAALGVGRMAVAGIAGAALAVGLAVVASPIAPVGLIRPAEPDPGIRVDGPVLVLGGLAVVVATVLVSIWPAVRSVRPRARDRRPAGAVTALLVRTGARPPAVMGARFALEPGPAAVPTRSTLVGAATGVVLVAATVTFAASLDHFVDSPDLYGQSWSHVLGIETLEDDEIDVATYQDFGRQLAEDDRIAAFSTILPGEIRIDGVSVPAFALDDSARPLRPTVIDGDQAGEPDEVLLGEATMVELGVEIGDAVSVTSPDGEEGSLTVVGRAVLPVVASYPGADKTTLGVGAILTIDGIGRWSPSFGADGVGLRYADGVDPTSVLADYDLEPAQYFDLVEVGLPSDVASLERVRRTPFLLSGLLVVLIALTVTHALGAAVRARRRELAILRTFGFSRSQVLRGVATQATLIGLFGLVVGLPLGIAAGRVLWSRVAESRDGVVSLVSPFVSLALVGLAVLLLANLAGLWPGLRAARAHPATILRTE